MNRPFNDQPIETLIDQNLANEGTVLDLRLKYIGDDGMEFYRIALISLVFGN